jgi:DNA polymerase III subunit epsilon
MRQVILDTETTGLDPALGHKIIEIAGVEIVNRRLTGNHFHRYVNPERDSEDAALQVHGLTREFLQDKPRFRDIADEFLAFIDGAELVIHNAAFDVAFIDHELKAIQSKQISACCPSVVDTLRLARDMYPGKRNSLDALCERHCINNSARTLHGALLDAQLLAEVYLAMTRGQESLIVEAETLQITIEPVHVSPLQRALTVLLASPEERAAHELELEDISKASACGCVWIMLEEARERLPLSA